MDLQRRHRASVAQAFPQKTPDYNIPVICPNVARHLQLLVKETCANEDFLVWDETRTDSDCCVLTAMQKLLLAIRMQRDRLQHYEPDLP